jgi:hypothetical protein
MSDERGQRLKTWAGRSTFSYEGSVAQGTLIRFGRLGWPVRIGAEGYRRLLEHFAGKTVHIGTSRDGPPPGSLGEWMQRHVTRTALASYVGPILVHEGYAERIPATPSGCGCVRPRACTWTPRPCAGERLTLPFGVPFATG